MRFMYDSTNIQDDPLDAQLVAYYVDGIYATSVAPVVARFPHAVLVPISAIGTNAGVVGDVEPGCMTVAEAVAWVQMRRATGADPTLYVNEMHGWAPVRFAFRSAGIPEPHYWVANYDGVAEIPAGAVAKQYANPTLTHGHFDLSVVADHWPGVDGLFGSSGGELDMATADQILAAVTMPPPPKPARFVAQSDQQLIDTIINVSSWDQIKAVYSGPGEYEFLQALAHPRTIAQAIVELQAKVAAMSASGSSTEPAEPAEPTKITGSFTGTLS